MSVRTRFAPSPTGVLHLGGLRTALYKLVVCQAAWRRVSCSGSRTRIASVSSDEHIRTLVEALKRFGLEPDREPLLQSSRLERHREVAHQLLETGHAYHCYCTPEELEVMRSEQRARGEDPGYDGRCRERTAPREGVEPVLRFRRPDAETVVVRDWLHGDVRYPNAQLDDLVLLRADGTPTYHLSCITDDEDVDVRQVIRGDDHLNNTPRQLQMIRALGWTPPEYCHLPLLLAPGGRKLSKRDEATDALHYLRAGYLPEAVLNYLARLGWSHGDQEVFTMEELVTCFGREGLGASAARLDAGKLNWINQQHMKASPPAALCDGLAAQLRRIGLNPDEGPPLEAVAEAWRERAETLADMAGAARWAFVEEIEFSERAAKKFLRPVVREPLATVRNALAGLSHWTTANIHSCIADTAESLGIGFGKLGQPLRVAITGDAVSPPIDTTLHLAGREATLSRLDQALAYIDARIAAADPGSPG